MTTNEDSVSNDMVINVTNNSNSDKVFVNQMLTRTALFNSKSEKRLVHLKMNLSSSD
jgi:hypothetical protein